MTETLSIVELISIIAAIGSSLYAINGLVKWRHEDRQRRRDGLNGSLRVFYRGKIRLYTLGLTAFILSLIRGIEAGLSPPHGVTPTPGFQTMASNTFATTRSFFVVAITALFLLVLVFDNRDRTLTDRAYDKKAEARLLAIEAAAKIAAERADATDAKADVAMTRADVAEQRADGAETRADVAEQRADTAADTADAAMTRADVAEQRADTAAITVQGLTPRVDSAEGELGVHTGEITEHTDRIGTLEKRDG